jgi:hypothetical protein
MLLEILEAFNYEPQLAMPAPILPLIALGVQVGSMIYTGVQNRKAQNDANAAAEIERQAQLDRDNEIKALERSRQQVIDRSDDIRALADSVVNPYQNLGVAMQGVNIRMEETDEALANTLDALNRSGVGAGAATQLARQAAASKAQVAASIENQELKNQQMYLSGEAQKRQQQLSIEQQAIQEEIGVYGRQEVRDVQQLNRLAGLSQNAAQRASDYQVAGQSIQASNTAAMLNNMGNLANIATSFIGTGGGNTTNLNTTGVTSPTPTFYVDPNQVGPYYSGNPNYGQQVNVSPSSSFSSGNIGSISGSNITTYPSDLRLKKNISKIGKSVSGLNIYEFDYINKKGTYQGVMSNEVPKEAVLVDDNGYDTVDYSKVDVDFKRIK